MPSTVTRLRPLLLAAAGAALAGGSFALTAVAQSGRASAPPQPGSAAASQQGPAPIPVRTATVLRRDLQHRVEVTGLVTVDDEVTLRSHLDGRVTFVGAKEGDRVRAGAVLVRLDDRELHARLTRARARLAAADATLSQAQGEATRQDTGAVSRIRTAEAALKAARARVRQAETTFKLVDTQTRTNVEIAKAGVEVRTNELKVFQNRARAQDVRQAHLEIEQAQAVVERKETDLELARRAFERREKLLKQDAISREERDEAERRLRAAEADLTVARAALETARQKADLTKEGSRGEEIRMAQGRLNSAQRSLVLAESELRKKHVAEQRLSAARAAEQDAEAALRAAQAGGVQVTLSQDQIEGARAVQEQARGEIQEVTAQLAHTVLRAPVAGVLSRRMVHVGESVTNKKALMELVGLEGAYVEARLSEQEVGALRPGIPCTVTVDALPGRRFAGTLREIVPVADRVSKLFRARIAVPGGKGQLPVGSFARATLDLGTRRGALALDRAAVTTEGGETFVWRVAAGETGLVARRQRVRLGLKDGQWVEVASGLRGGDRIITAGSPALIDGSPIKITGD